MPILGIIASSTLVAAGDFESIATVSVGSGGAADVEFTSIPATYTHLQIRVLARGTNASASIYQKIQFNSDTSSIYADHYLLGDGASASAGASINAAFIGVGSTTGASATASIFGTIIVDVLDYANTNKFKTIRNLEGFDVNGSGGFVMLTSGLYRSTSAITSIKLTPNAGNYAQYSSFALYGCKSA
jgi:hypothetical protein